MEMDSNVNGSISGLREFCDLEIRVSPTGYPLNNLQDDTQPDSRRQNGEMDTNGDLVSVYSSKLLLARAGNVQT